MSILTLRGINVSFGAAPVLEHVDLRIEAGERVCLVGRNGEGKSTLLKLIAGELMADEGLLEQRQGLRVAALAQQLPGDFPGSVYELVATGVGEVGDLLARYHQLSQQLGQGDTEQLAELERIQHALESRDGWRVGQRVETVLSRLQLPGDAVFRQLSGGLQRRVMLARALVGEPDLLLLDEPTNHLDIEAIRWLEDFLLGFQGTLLFITHDRVLLQKLATRIVELDRGRLYNWPGDYQTYLRRKQAALDAENAEQALQDKKLAREEQWIRQGIKARRTRNEGRVRALQKLREQRRARRVQPGKVQLRHNEVERSGRMVVEALGVSHSYGDRPLIRDFSTLILRGDKVGVIGPNGVGKSTLLQLLLGQLTPQQGEIRLGTRLEIAYFDQRRSQLNEEKSIVDNVADGSEEVTVNGRPRHVISYLQDFLFAPARLRTPVKALSGGERNRLLLARLFARPANLLVMDEPTNDLDLETLELLESLLVDFPGTLLLVSHDRAFIDNVVTSTLVFEGEGRIAEYVGGYADWLRQRPAATLAQPGKQPPPRPQAMETRRNRLSYKEQRELDTLPQRIETLEAEQQALLDTMAMADYYRRDSETIAADKSRLANLEQELAAVYRQWEELEARRAG